MAVPDLSDPALPFAAAARELGRGWKVSPFIKPKAGETATIMDVDGPGVIQHIWIVSERDFKGNGRAGVLRFYWDGEETPSVEVPLTDFFAIGHERFAPVNSLAVVANHKSALNCYWPMPFRRHCRITFTNENYCDMSLFTYQITYALTDVPQDAGYFHAQWRRAVTDRANPDYVILDGVRGRGRYVGTFLAWTQLSDGWSGEGEMKFYMDGDRDFPTICGTGTEDYFGASYGFPRLYSGPYAGCTLAPFQPAQGEDLTFSGPPKWSLYRWHIMDPVCFEKDLRVTIQALGWWMDKSNRYQPLADDIASTAYWYQTEPHAAFPALPKQMQRIPR